MTTLLAVTALVVTFLGLVLVVVGISTGLVEPMLIPGLLFTVAGALAVAVIAKTDRRN